MLTVLFAASDANWAEYAAPLRHAFAESGLDATLTREADPQAVDYIVYAPSSPCRIRALYALQGGAVALGRGGTHRGQPDPDPAPLPPWWTPP